MDAIRPRQSAEAVTGFGSGSLGFYSDSETLLFSDLRKLENAWFHRNSEKRRLLQVTAIAPRLPHVFQFPGNGD